MIPVFHICQDSLCNVILTGLSYDEELYLSEASKVQPYYKFKYSETITINVVELNKVNETKVTDVAVSLHESDMDESHIPIKTDGHYRIYHVILPTKEWLDNIIETDKSFLEFYDRVYVADEKGIYKYSNDNIESATIEEIIMQEVTDKTTISMAIKEMFSICQLWKCYVNICQNLFDSDLNKCTNKSSDLDTLKFNRDFVQMTINVLQYYVAKEQLEEAERLLEQVEGCNSVCSQSFTVKGKSHDCGCSKQNN